MTLKSLYSYPIKSASGIEFHSAFIENLGINFDRRWMLIDEHQKFVTARSHPNIVLIKTKIKYNKVFVNIPGQEELLLDPALECENRIDVKIWKDTVSAGLLNNQINLAFSRFLGQSLRLVYMDAKAVRHCDQKYAINSELTSFADSFPYLLISQQSLDDLNTKLDKKVSMLNFRPNIIINANSPFEEDLWKRIKIGSVEFDLVKACSRCIFTTIDPHTAKKDPNSEPLKTLLTYRKGDRGVYFGQNLIPRNNSTINIGDVVEVLEFKNN